MNYTNVSNEYLTIKLKISGQSSLGLHLLYVTLYNFGFHV